LENLTRCAWANNSIMIDYHDDEWGVPLHDDNRLFEMLTLEGAQAGLSWLTILKRRDEYRKAFCGFDPKKVAKLTQTDIEKLLNNEGIIRNKLKIRSTISNAKAFMKIQNEFGSFDQYLWKFVNYSPIKNHFKKHSELPSSTKLSDLISKDLKSRGFTFVGTTICYAFMQATGLVNDHTTNCFRFQKLQKNL